MVADRCVSCSDSRHSRAAASGRSVIGLDLRGLLFMKNCPVTVANAGSAAAYTTTREPFSVERNIGIAFMTFGSVSCRGSVVIAAAKGVGDQLGPVPVRQTDEHQVAGRAVHQRRDRAPPTAADQITLPVSGHRPIRGLGRSLGDVQDVRPDPAAVREPGAGGAAGRSAGA